MKRLIPVFLLALAACDGLKPPRPPTYNESCVPSHDHYVVMANDQQDMMDVSSIPTDPQEAYDAGLAVLQEHGVEVVTKGDKDPTASFTTTLPGKIFLSANFDKQDIRIQAETLWHEYVHVLQWERMGEVDFVQYYAFTEGRWALEVPAYRQGFRVLRHVGVPEEKLDPYLQDRFLSLYEKYGLQVMPQECAEKLTFDIWNQDVR